MYKFKFLNALIVVLILLQAVMPLPALAMTGTDLPDYAPGSTVTFSGDNSDGAGYLPSESVRVEVSGPGGFASTCEAVADENGAWSCQVTLPSDAADGNYSYTATGQTSGASESASFTVTAPPPPPTVEPTQEPTQEPTVEPTTEPTTSPLPGLRTSISSPSPATHSPPMKAPFCVATVAIASS